MRRIQSKHSDSDRGLDAYFTPPEATRALLRVEKGRIPSRIWEPACGNGAIVKELVANGYQVNWSDLINYGFPGTILIDYLDAPMTLCQGMITNPPYKLAEEFLARSLKEHNYTALLLRTNFLESVGRLGLFRRSPPSRVWISSRRLPMMHREGWDGPESTSNTCYAWFIWEAGTEGPCALHWFDWAENLPKVGSAEELGF